MYHMGYFSISRNNLKWAQKSFNYNSIKLPVTDVTPSVAVHVEILDEPDLGLAGLHVEALRGHAVVHEHVRHLENILLSLLKQMHFRLSRITPFPM